MHHPTDRKYAATHEWAKVEGELIVTGISDHAQDALGDLVYVELPEVGQHVQATEQIGVVESVKTASDIHMPITGTVVEVNTTLDDDPEVINEDPYHNGWIYKIKPDHIEDFEKLLTQADYEAGL